MASYHPLFRLCAPVLLLLTIAADAAAQALAPHASGEVLVGFHPTATAAERIEAFAAAGAQAAERLGTVSERQSPTGGVYRVVLSGGVAGALEQLQEIPAVAFVEPNYLVQPAATADDPAYVDGSLWGLYGDDAPVSGPAGTTDLAGSDAEEAWLCGATGSRRVFVGVIDGGVSILHPDLAANVWSNADDQLDGADNDGNGFVDDTHGWDFYNGDNTLDDGVEGGAHGSQVSGVIGAVGGNGIGTVGVSWAVSLIPAKILGPEGGYVSDAVRAISYLRDLKSSQGLPIVAINASWSGGGYSSALHTAIIRAAKQEILFVAAAGNGGSDLDLSPSFPAGYSTLQSSAIEPAAAYEGVIAVAAIDSTGHLAPFSSFGASGADIAAPGVGILSTGGDRSYGLASGTSLAAAHVSGALALYASAHPEASAAQLRAAILGNAARSEALNGLVATGGRLSLAGLFGACEGSGGTALPSPTVPQAGSAQPAEPGIVATPGPDASTPAVPTPAPTPTSTPTPMAAVTTSPVPGAATIPPESPEPSPTARPAAALKASSGSPSRRSIAITSISDLGVVGPGAAVPVRVHVSNSGSEAEIITVALAVSAGAAGVPQTILVPARSNIELTFIWTAPAAGKQIMLEASTPVIGDGDLSVDNTRRVAWSVSS